MAKELNGLYLVVDPGPGLKIVAQKVKSAILGGVDIIQIWNNWNERQDKKLFITTLYGMAQPKGIKVLINDEYEWLAETRLDGVHFDRVPENGLKNVRESVNRPFIAGLTCGNSVSEVYKAKEEGFDYISFCSMFPSPSAGTCEIVDPETVRAACKIFKSSVFAAGGITPHNAGKVLDTGVDGIAVISGIMGTDDPETATRQFKNLINKYRYAEKND